MIHDIVYCLHHLGLQVLLCTGPEHNGPQYQNQIVRLNLELWPNFKHIRGSAQALISTTAWQILGLFKKQSFVLPMLMTAGRYQCGKGRYIAIVQLYGTCTDQF